ncbi:hypothetical protein [Pseudomonas syringae]|uniref:hypothetical protein n=1 Tax=Pseudomonas syringae TaxID=317 RepID=UPI0018E646B2|nr:hypothetical protein [Pseudomonas syringae]MBI6794663.1 hypothetical protein [Pseudomonas syringae]
MSEIKELPILFSAPMVRAVLSGQKTVTRRVVKVQPFDLSWSRRDHRFEYLAGRAVNGDEIDGFYAYSTRSGGEWSAKCPYGQPGDRLWVREAWQADAQVNAIAPRELSHGEPIQYPADGASRQTGCSMITPGKTRPSIHMPRWASRILLEITDVRVERLQDISEDQAKAEGVRLYTDHAELGEWWHVDGIETYSADPRKSFELLWTSVGGDWNANPWVWVVEFKRVTP